MSLRTKIILLFGLLAIVPMLVLAGFSYGYARSLLREAVQDQLRQTATIVGGELESGRAVVERQAEALAATLSTEASGAGERGEPAVHPDSLLARAAFIALRDPSGSLRVLAGSVPARETRCSDGESSGLLEVSRDLPGEGDAATLQVGFWVSDLLTGGGRSLSHEMTVVDPSDGAVLYADRCDGMEAGHRLDRGSGLMRFKGMPGTSGTFRFNSEGESRVGAFALVPGPGWGVVALASPDGILEPLSRMATAYWIFVLGLGVTTALAFGLLIGRFTRSLSELARAAEEIGLGELDPWLPLHTTGELGQLTEAFSDMLTRIRQMMAQVDQSGRLAVVGQLSAYLAHEIRNPLSSIKLNLQRLRRWTQSGDLPAFCLEPLEISLREVERLNASVTGVLQLSRAEDSPREMVSLHDLVEEAADLLASKFRRQGVGLSLELDAEADRVLARTGQVKSAVLNLMVNALEAQPGGGRLEIRSELSRAPEMGGPVLAVHFKDDGPGVPREVRDRIFEPFFTTKAGGAGIGLAMASQCVRGNGGEIRLEPSFSVGRGSDFVMVLPLASLEARAVGSRTEPGAPTVRDGWLPVRQVSSDAEPTLPARDLDGQGATGSPGQGQSEVPTHLLTPEGLRAVLALTRPDSEEEVH